MNDLSLNEIASRISDVVLEEWFRYKYVHELQNLFFAITGTELELKTYA